MPDREKLSGAIYRFGRDVSWDIEQVRVKDDIAYGSWLLDIEV